MANFTAGTSFSDGVTNDVTAAKLNALVADAVPTSNLSLNSTTGTIATFNSTTGTIATLNSTTGTIATLNSTTGTIPTLVATTLITTGTGTAAAPAIVPTGDTNTGIFFPAADTIAFAEGGAEAMRIASSGNVGIGITAPDATLTVEGGVQVRSTNKLHFTSTLDRVTVHAPLSDTLAFSTTSTERLRIDSSGNVGVGTASPIAPLHIRGAAGRYAFPATSGATQSNGLTLRLNDASDDNAILDIGGNSDSGYWLQATNNANLALNYPLLLNPNGGNVLIGKTATALATAGVSLDKTANEFTVSANPVMYVNRSTSDGTLIGFYQDNTLEGSISVSGTTVSYNGGHLSRWSQLLSGQRDLAIKKGTVLSNLDAMCEWRDADGNLLPNEQLNKVKISDVEGDSNTAGVFVNWDNDDQDNPYDLNMAMTGDMIIRIAQGTIVNRGDLLMSAGNGTAKPQGDDIIRSKTIAKVTSTNVTCTYEDGSYCVPCVLMAC